MGIYDREYYRDETSGSRWFSGVAPACKTIILINIAIFIVEFGSPNAPWLAQIKADSNAIFHHWGLWRLLTAPFVSDPSQMFGLLWNMLFLWMAGRELEALYGTREFSYLYATAAVFSTLAWAAIDAMSGSSHEPVALGASGAVMTLLVLYVLYYPRREILLFFVLPIEAWLLLVVYLAFCTLQVFLEMGHTAKFGSVSTSFAGVLGGATYGYVYKAMDLRWTRLLARRKRPRLRVIAPEIRERDRSTPMPAASARSAGAGGTRASSSDPLPEEQLDARLDEVLAKIAREGRNGLTDEENRVLQRASQRARDRRSDRV